MDVPLAAVSLTRDVSNLKDDAEVGQSETCEPVSNKHFFFEMPSTTRPKVAG